jgi:hypothetical protein
MPMTQCYPHNIVVFIIYDAVHSAPLRDSCLLKVDWGKVHVSLKSKVLHRYTLQKRTGLVCLLSLSGVSLLERSNTPDDDRGS